MSRPVRVCHVTTMGYIATFVIAGELAGLRRLGYDVHVIAPDDEHAETLAARGITLHPVAIPRTIRLGRIPAAYRALRRVFRRERFDIVHTHQATSGVLGRVAARRAHVPVVIHTEHGLPAYDGQSRIAFESYRLLLRTAARYCDCIVSENREDLTNMLQWRIAPVEKIAYQGTGIDIAAADAQRDTDRSALRRELQLPSDAFVFLMAARFEPVKNHAMLMAALDSPWFKTSNAVCILTGTGELEATYRARAASHPARDRIRFLGFRNDLQRLLPAFDVFVLTSVKEGVPHVVQEAAVAGLPVVATDVLGTREAVVDGETGVLVPLDDVDALTAALARLAGDVAWRQQLSVAASSYARRHFGIDNIVERLDEIYRRLLARQRPS